MIILEDCDRTSSMHWGNKNESNIESPWRRDNMGDKQNNLTEINCDMKWFITEFITTTMTG